MTSVEHRRTPVRVFLRGSQSLRSNLLSTSHGGDKLGRGIVEIVSEQFPDHFLEVSYEECQGARSFRNALTESGPAGETRVREFEPDLLVLGADADLLASARAWGNGLAETFESNMLEVIRLVKRDLDSRVIMLSASSVVPNEAVSNYRGLDEQTRALETHRLNLATMHLSREEGISIVDVDRIMAELGGSEHVLGYLDYSPHACEAIASEFVRVIADYGFFDNRPLLPQVGKGAENH